MRNPIARVSAFLFAFLSFAFLPLTLRAQTPIPVHTGPAVPFIEGLLGDSKTVGIGDPAAFDYLVVAGAANSSGSGYTVLPTITVNGPTDGTGFACHADFALDGGGNVNGQVCVVIDNAGRGYNDPTKVPLLTFSGGNGTGAAATLVNAGGWTERYNAALQARGLLASFKSTAVSGTQIQNCAANGSEGQGMRGALGARGYAPGQPALQNAVIDIDTMVNDAQGNVAASPPGTPTGNDIQDTLTGICNTWLTLGVRAIIIDLPYAVPTGSAYTNGGSTSATTLNNYMVQYAAAVRYVAAHLPNVYVGADLQAVIVGHPEYFTPTGGVNDLHANAAGDAALGGAKAAAHAPILAGLFGQVTAAASLSASDEALLASIAGLQKSNTAVILPTLPPVTLAATQSFNNTGQTSAPGWLGISSVLLPADHTAIAGDVQAGLTAQGWTTALVTQLAAQVARIYGAEWGTVTPLTGGGYSVSMPSGALTIPAPGAALGTVAPAYDSAGKPTTTTKTVN